MTSQRIEWLDLVRGLAAIAVVVFHYQAYLQVRHAGYGLTAVDIFFALSGIVLALKYTQAIESGMGPLEFAGVRLRRLYPMVLVAGTFIVALDLAGVPSGASMPAADTDAWAIFLVMPVSTGGMNSAFPADPPMWSFWAELAANAVWFVVLKFGRRWMFPLGVASMAILIFATLRANNLNLGWEAGGLYRLISVARALAWFSVGCAIAMRPSTLRMSAVMLVAALTVFVVVAHFAGGREGLNQFLCATTGVALLNLAYRLPSPGMALGAISRWLGMLSFPLYMMHAPAGRLLPYVHGLPRWATLVLVVGAAALAATLVNESLVDRVNRFYRERRKASPARIGEG
ncbi:acyltransferase family protein [Scleromatobacter humisilvae]|uniref:Acyltransferase n=1 Tax=Scleromatobacter humisilvae TaxID=2897159 RepID=A0A9X1YJI2_9BURK|nr:acyltransferase [Scleromatobacter humisilvae]MCK9685933.1 acyltransferase [Scleromatobacter humisilvae]